MTKNRGIGAGRPTKYYTHVEPRLLQVEEWAMKRMQMQDIAKELGISVATLYEYKHEYPDLLKAIEAGWARSGSFVESQLFKKIAGTKLTDVEYERSVVGTDKDGKPIWEMVPVKTKVREVASDTTALIFALKNHLPERYADKTGLELSGSVETAAKQMTDEELQAAIEEMKRKGGGS